MKGTKFDISNYYDSNLNEYVAPKENLKQEILDYLYSQLICVVLECDYLLCREVSAEELGSINIVIELKKEKRSKYCNKVVFPIKELKKYLKNRDD